jgi:YfiH family protein
MIRPDPMRGAAFGDADDGDPRRDPGARRSLSDRLAIPDRWAWMRQVHGSDVVRAEGPGELGEADAAFTLIPGLPLAVATADCFPVIIEADNAVGIAHAGWRGAALGVVAALRRAMEASGAPPQRAAVGPGIGPCCFEVSADVADRFPGNNSVTSWGTSSVDLPGALAADLAGLETWWSGLCTMSGDGFHSYRRDHTEERQVAVAWLPA